MRFFTRLTRYLSHALKKIIPWCDAVTCDEQWEQTKADIRAACRKQFKLHGHCEMPYAVGDLRRDVWAEEVYKIAAEVCSGTMADPFIIEGEFVREICGVHHLPSPPPAPVPMAEVIYIEDMFRNDGKRLIHWNGEYVHI